MHTCRHTYTDTPSGRHAHTQAFMQTHSQKVCTHRGTCSGRHVHTQVHTHVHTQAGMYASTHIWVHTGTQSGRYAHTCRHTHMDTPSGRCAHTQTYTRDTPSGGCAHTQACTQVVSTSVLSVRAVKSSLADRCMAHMVLCTPVMQIEINSPATCSLASSRHRGYTLHL